MKRVTDLSVGELADMATAAWRDAAEAAISKGHSITGTRDGRRIRYFPDGHFEDLGPISPLPEKSSEGFVKKNRPKSVA